MDEESLRIALEKIASRQWPCRLIEKLIVPSSTTTLNRDALDKAIVSFMNQIDPTEETNLPQVLGLLTKVGENIGHSELLRWTHTIWELVPLRVLIEYIQICLTLMKPDAIAVAIQSLITIGDDEKELPPMLMRTIIQSLTLHRSLTGLVVGILVRILPRNPWNTKILWDGFIRCIKVLGPASHAILLQLPVERLIDLLSTLPDIKTTFQIYLSQQSAAVQGRYQGKL